MHLFVVVVLVIANRVRARISEFGTTGITLLHLEASERPQSLLDISLDCAIPLQFLVKIVLRSVDAALLGLLFQFKEFLISHYFIY